MSVPGPPNINVLPFASPNTLEYEWEPPTQENGTISAYKLLLTTGGSNAYSNSSIAPTRRSYVVGPPEITLVNGVSYAATLQAINENGEGNPASFYVFQPGSVPTLPPSTISVTAFGNSDVLVSWTPPAQAVDSTIFWYGIYASSINTSNPQVSYTANGLTDRNYYLSGLNNVYNYIYSVYAVNCPGWSPPATYILAPLNSFSPSSLSNLTFWLDAATITGVTNNSPITTWVDKSSNAFSGTAVNGPTFITNAINGNSIVRFNGSNQYVNYGNVLNLGTTGLSMFTVAKYRTSSNGGLAGKSASIGTNGRYSIVRDTGNMTGILMVNNNASLVYPDSSTSIQMVELFWDRNSNTFYQNGTFRAGQSLINSTNITTTHLFYVGAYQDSSGLAPLSGYYFDGDMAEIIMYNSNLNIYPRQQVEGYLAWKWGLQTNLYSGHPFRYAAPTSAPIPFIPSMLANLQIWYDGADPLGTGTAPATGTSIPTWFDKSSFARNATAVVAANYSNDTPYGYLNFNGTSTCYNMSGSFIANQYFTTFIVERLQAPTDPLNPQTITSGSTSGASILIRYRGSNASNINLINSTSIEPTVPSFTTAAAQPTRLYSFSQLTSDRRIYLNGTSIGNDTNNSLISSWNGAQIGRDNEFASRYYNGQMKEIIFYTGQITTAQRQIVEGYLAWKWGLQSSLPSGHPYLTAPPTSANLP